MTMKMPDHRSPSDGMSSRQKAVAYLRVSTGRQAEQGMSLPEQQRQVAACAELNAFALAQTFCDRGLTGRTETREQFQAMMRYIRDPANGVGAVVVYHSSRLFRNAQLLLKYHSELESRGIRLISATQALPDGHNGKLLLTMLAAFDAHASDQNAEQVRTVMTANAEAGYWNGAKPPFGYKTAVALVLRSKEKKVLVESDEEAPVVRLIFRLYRDGDGSGPMGLKKIVAYLNSHRYSYRGKPFYTSAVEKILKGEVYTGTFRYNCIDSRTRKPRPESAHIKVKVPVIIPMETWLATQRALRDNRPNVRAPRLTTGPTLLSGIAICEHCEGGMQLRTGKSGAYRYLTCANKANKGELSCRGQSVRMDAVDEAVLSAMEVEVFAPRRLKHLMGEVIDASNAGLEALEKDIARLQASLNNDKAALERLYLAIEKGIVDMLDKAFAQRIADVKLRIGESEERIRDLKNRRVLHSTRISDDRVAAFSQQVRERLRSADPAFRRAWLHLFVERVVIGPDEIRILGPKQALAEGLVQGNVNPGTMVPSFDREWRARNDSNWFREEGLLASDRHL
ncbi:MAG: recombinase family protein [Bosea sp. (in: a-proteobacteria)]|uniref:recombinase family protein n=1 Tax=Bosea sp. (in: a-proteobacteria) TaxID=1871050 RepID=UPI003F7C68CF